LVPAPVLGIKRSQKLVYTLVLKGIRVEEKTKQFQVEIGLFLKVSMENRVKEILI
jgi:hypothetical protein